MARSEATKSVSKLASTQQRREIITEREVDLEIDAILHRLEVGIAREKVAMSALLSRLRTTRVAA